MTVVPRYGVEFPMHVDTKLRVAKPLWALVMRERLQGGAVGPIADVKHSVSFTSNFVRGDCATTIDADSREHQSRYTNRS